jgi:hypothetical protein
LGELPGDSTAASERPLGQLRVSGAGALHPTITLGIDDAYACDIDTDLGLADIELIDVPPGAPPPDLSLWDTVRRLGDIGGVDRAGALFVSAREVVGGRT